MNLGAMFAEHERKADKVRDPERLFVSDVGKCPRQVAYRLVGTDKDHKSEQAKVNSEIMWGIAEYLESTLWSALQAEGRAIAFQFGVDLYDRENWGGRGDIIADYMGRRVIEVKSLYPGAFSHEINYPAHQHQGFIYDHYCAEEYELDATALLWYVDRGGQNTPVEQDLGWMNWDVTGALMDELDKVREGIPNLPDKLPRVLVERSYGKNLVHECAWQCGRCDYVWTCEPDTSKSVWAERKSSKEPFTPKKAADMNVLMKYAEEQLVTILS